MTIDLRLIILSGVFVTLFMTSNLMAVKLIDIGGIILPAAVICFPFCFAVGDLINEFYGAKTSARVIAIAFVLNALSVGLLALAVVLPSAAFYDGGAFRSIFLSAPRILGAGLAAFVVSGALNTLLFDKIRKADGRLFWLRSGMSTVCSVITDSFVFITLAFVGTMPFGDVMMMVVWQSLAKLIIGIGLGTSVATATVKLLKRYANTEKVKEKNAL